MPPPRRWRRSMRCARPARHELEAYDSWEEEMWSRWQEAAAEEANAEADAEWEQEQRELAGKDASEREGHTARRQQRLAAREKKKAAKKAEMEAALEREREKRVEQVGAQALKRIVQQDLAKGWGAWHAVYSEHLRQKRMLAGAASRLTKPALVACMSHWRSEWEAAPPLPRSVGAAA